MADATLESVIVLDDALSPAVLHDCQLAIDRLQAQMQEVSRHEGAICYRRYQNYDAPDPVLVAAIQELLWRESLVRRAEEIPDLAWRLFAAGVATTLDMQVTSYAAGGQYTWHTDHLVRSRTHNFVLYMTDPEYFRGGVLEVSLDPPSMTIAGVGALINSHMEVTPRKNRLVLMPAHLVHRVTPVSGLSPGAPFWSTRVTINGHVRTGVGEFARQRSQQY